MASHHGIDIPIAALLGILLVLFAAMWFSWSTFAGRSPFLVGWQHQPSPSAVARQLILPNLLELVLWLLIVSWLGWRRAVGLVRGSASMWGIVPLAMLWVATLLAAGLTDVVSKGVATVLLAAIGYFIAALNEEIAYRGFLLHGFTRRFGGTAGVLLSSGIFALMHIPTLLEQGEPYIVGILLYLFGDGVILCRIRVATGSLWFPTAIHTLHNLTFTGIVIWAFSEGHAPAAYGWLLSAYSLTGFILAIGLCLRWYIPRAMGRLVSTATGAPEGNHLPAPQWWGVQVGPSALESFTDEARRVVVQAERESRAEQSKSIGTEHLLLGLLHQSDGVAARALEATGLSVGPRERLEELLDGDQGPSPATLPWHARTKMVLQLAIREADERGHDDVAPEHLLLALTAIRAGEAFRALRSSGIDPGQLRRTLLRLMTEASWREASLREDGDLEHVAAPVRPREKLAGRTFDVFPEPIRSILDIANAEARAIGSSSLGTRQLLSALCRERGGIVARSLEATGLASTAAPATPVDVAKAPNDTLPLTPRAKKAIDAAIRLADEMGAAPVGPEHVFLALIDERRGDAAHVLVGRGVELDQLRTIAIGFMSEPGSVSAEETVDVVKSPEG